MHVGRHSDSNYIRGRVSVNFRVRRPWAFTQPVLIFFADLDP